MICQCGNQEIKPENFKIEDFKKAVIYSQKIKKNDLPIEIEIFECKCCGRNGYEVFDFKNFTIDKIRI